MPTDLSYIAVLFALFVVPKVLQRLRVPGALTSLAMGFGASLLGWFREDDTVQLLSTFGIVALFLTAGMEIELGHLRRVARVLAQHLAIRSLTLTLGALVFGRLLDLEVRPAALMALAVLTPSTGFILDSLAGFGLTAEEAFWVKAKAIAAELLALAVLFVVTQSTSVQQLGLASLALGALILLLPVTFRLFAERIAPWAPRSEFAFLLMVGVVCAYATKKLGVYYLVGAFLVGMAAQRFRERLPAMSTEQLLLAVQSFASVFIPFYFFRAGLQLRPEHFTWRGLAVGAGLLGVVVPLRLGLQVLHRQLALGEPPRQGLRVGLALTPTLVFSLVVATILRDQFALPPELFGGIVLYTVVNTALPALVLRVPPPEFEAPIVTRTPPTT